MKTKHYKNEKVTANHIGLADQVVPGRSASRGPGFRCLKICVTIDEGAKKGKGKWEFEIFDAVGPKETPPVRVKRAGVIFVQQDVDKNHGYHHQGSGFGQQIQNKGDKTPVLFPFWGAQEDCHGEYDHEG